MTEPSGRQSTGGGASQTHPVHGAAGDTASGKPGAPPMERADQGTQAGATAAARASRCLTLLPWMAVAIACAPLLWWGYPRGHDWLFELVRIAEYRHALEAAARFDAPWPPAWAPNLYGGYGSPIFLFYAPLFAAVVAAASWLTTSIDSAAVVTLVLATAVGAIVIRGLLRAVLPPTTAGPTCVPLLCEQGPAPQVAAAAARVALYVYVLHPYLLGDKLIRNANAEFTALCLAPLCLWGLVVLKSRPRAGVLMLSAGLALTILSHNLTALVAVALVVIFAAFLIVPRYGRPEDKIDPRPAQTETPPSGSGSMVRHGWRGAGALLAAAALGLAISAFFWIPAVILMPQVRTEELLTGKFDFHTQFPTLANLIYASSFYAAGWLTPLLLVACCVTAALRRARPVIERHLLNASLVASAALTFLMTPASTFLWEHVPLMPLFQFPWRLVGPLALMVALGTGLSFAGALAQSRLRWVVAAELAVFAACVANAVPVLRHTSPLSPEELRGLPERLEPTNIQAEHLSATVRDEYLPRADERANWRKRKTPTWPIEGFHGRIVRLHDAGTLVTAGIESEHPATIQVARWFFPGWGLRIDGKPAPLRACREGLLEFDVPASRSVIELRYRPPHVRFVGTLLSVLAVITWVALAVFRRHSDQ